MKCPFCGIEMKRMEQDLSHPAFPEKRILVLWDHPNIETCEHGSSYDKTLGYCGHTISEDSWMKRYNDLNS